MANRYELLEEIDLPFPLGGCFGYFGYELKQFVEPRLPLTALNDLELPECSVGFYDSLVVFDHQLGKVWLISTGLDEEGDRCPKRTQAAVEFWTEHLASLGQAETTAAALGQAEAHAITSTLSHDEYCAGVRRSSTTFGRATFIRPTSHIGWPRRRTSMAGRYTNNLATASPAPFSAFMQCGEFQLASSSPEQFLQLSGSQVTTCPIKGTRPRGATPDLDARLGYELQSSEKERAELVMITDLLRNDLGGFCEYGSVIGVPDLAKLERFAQVQHLVSTVTGRLRPGVTHLQALASSFPGAASPVRPRFVRWRSSTNWSRWFAGRTPAASATLVSTARAS